MNIKASITTVIFLFISVFANAQTLSYYYDASITQLKGYGYSYNLSVSLKKSQITNYGVVMDKYEIKLLKVTPDTKGFLLNGKYYSSVQLGNGCEPQNFTRVRISFKYQHQNVSSTSVTQTELNSILFSNIGDIKYIQAKNISNFTIESAVVVYDDDDCVAKIKELQNPKKNVSNTQASSVNQKSTEVEINSQQRQNNNNNNNNAFSSTEQNTQSFNNPLPTKTNDQQVTEYWNNQVQQSQQNLNQSVDNFTNTLNQWAENRREEREAERQAQWEAHLEQLERDKQLRLKVSNRKNIINKFPPRDIPLGSQEKAARLYYFIYAYDNLDNEYTTIYVSNAFEIGKYADGTRAYTATIKSEIENLTPFSEVLHGYYYTQQEAEQAISELIGELQNNNVTIRKIVYKGKPSTANTKNNSVENNGSKYGTVIGPPAKIDTRPTNGVTPNDKIDKTTEKKDKDYGKIIR